MMGWFKRFFEKKREPETPKAKPEANADILVNGLDSFDVAMKLVLGFEGGVSNHKADKGGLTNFGVTQATYNAHLNAKGLPTRSVREITAEEVKEIYFKFWIDSGAQKLPLKAGIAVFDMAINSGPGRARRYWSLAKGDVDRFMDLREQFYRGLVAKDSSQKVFLNGWLNRLAHLKGLLLRIKN